MKPNSKYLSVQLLRAVAALMVVMYHSKSAFEAGEREQLWWWPGLSDHGAMGVSLFFVISGFIIASVISRPSFHLGNYLWRRFLRIYPLYWIVMGAGLIAFLQRGRFRYDIETLGVAGMIQSFLILPLKPFPFWSPGWTLEHEVLFYAIAALVAPLLGLRALAVVMFGLGAVGFLVTLPWDFHLFADPQIYFGAGVVAFLLRNTRWLPTAAAAAVLLFVSYGNLYGLIPLPAPVATCVFAFAFSAVVVTFVAIENGGWRPPAALVSIGDASYSLYLWHWMMLPVIASVRYYTVGGPPEIWRWVFILASVAVALVSYRFIEKPIIAFSHVWRPKPRLATGA